MAKINTPGLESTRNCQTKPNHLTSPTNKIYIIFCTGTRINQQSITGSNPSSHQLLIIHCRGCYADLIYYFKLLQYR